MVNIKIAKIVLPNTCCIFFSFIFDKKQVVKLECNAPCIRRTIVPKYINCEYSIIKSFLRNIMPTRNVDADNIPLENIFMAELLNNWLFSYFLYNLPSYFFSRDFTSKTIWLSRLLSIFSNSLCDTAKIIES